MKKKIIILSTCFIGLCILFSGCLSSGLLISANTTNVQLSKGNYKIVATSVKGQASAGYLVGLTAGIGLYTQTFALIPLTKERHLYTMAIEDLWKNFEAKNANGAIVGRKLALVNIHYDSDAINVFVYTRPRVTITADVVEFLE